MAGRLAGKVAVVTGSTSGIGAGIAARFACEGARVVVSGRRESEGQTVVETIRAAGGQAVFQSTDVAVPEDCRRVVARAVEEFGGLDILVNNAGIFPRMPFLETTPEFWDQIFTINLRGAFLCAQAAVPPMRERGGGCILNIGSGGAFLSGDLLFAYGISKGALFVMTQNLARNLAKDRIRANFITVGWVLTEKEFEIQALEGRDHEALLAHQKQLPMGQFNTVEDIAASCLYLASEDGERVTGCELNVSAGLRIRV